MTATARFGPQAVRFDAMGPRDIERWHELRAANPSLTSPYFHPGFAAALHKSGRDVVVVVDRDTHGNAQCLLPLHVDGAVGRPAGWPGADFQGPVLAPGTPFSPRAMMAAAGVGRFGFDHLYSGLPEFAPFVVAERASPFLDISGGMDGYLGRASRSGRDNFGQARRRARKAEKELGPVRFEFDSGDPALLDRVIELKRAQYAATGAVDYFADPRHRDLVHRLLQVRDAAFGGVLSAIHAGPHLVAAHFGLRSGGVLHWWFPVYDPAYGHLAPGWQLLRELVATGPDQGITRIDLGRGDDEYKRRAMTGQTQVLEGVVTPGSLGVRLLRMQTAAMSAAKSSPLAPQLRVLARRIRGARR